MDKLHVKREYKDTVFRMLFRKKEELLELYNALNETAYDNPEDLKVYTLDNAIYMNVKNDVSFLVDAVLSLYEQQSTVNPNMPLRDLMYVARQMEKYMVDRSVYSSRRVRLPLPRFVVFYNGTKAQPERQVLKLSDAYLKKAADPDLELKVTVININVGYNGALMEKCRTLKEYSIYVDRVRQYAKELPIEEAVRRSVDECIREGILSDFLKSQKAEVIAMSIFEYNEETELKKIREDEYELGWEAGMEAGRKAGAEEGRKAGVEEGIEIGIRALVETCRDLKITKAETIDCVSSRFLLSGEKAAGYVERFW